MEKLREIIGRARKANGTSFDELARALDCTVEELTSFEDGRSSVRAEILFGLVNFLNIPPESVMPLFEEPGFRYEVDVVLSSDELMLPAAELEPKARVHRSLAGTYAAFWVRTNLK